MKLEARVCMCENCQLFREIEDGKMLNVQAAHKNFDTQSKALDDLDVNDSFHTRKNIESFLVSMK